jgi:2'-5' RNA ligase
MRVFIGIKPDDSVREMIGDALKPFQKISTPIKWVKPENIHITLKFIGEIGPVRKDQLIDRLKNARFQSAPISLHIFGFGKFGPGENLNIFWAGIEPSPPLKQVYDRIEETLAEMGIPRETRPFKSHLTLGRNKKHVNLKMILTLIEQYRDVSIARFTADGFHIFKSNLTAEGPIYSILEEVKLSHA